MHSDSRFILHLALHVTSAMTSTAFRRTSDTQQVFNELSCPHCLLPVIHHNINQPGKARKKLQEGKNIRDQAHEQGSKAYGTISYILAHVYKESKQREKWVKKKVEESVAKSF